MNESQTQSELIEPALRAAGWEPGMYKKEWPITAETKPGVKRYKQLRADYVLVYKNRKLAIAFQIAWKLFQAKWNLRRDGRRRPRILFLADRNVLADQAFNSFGTFEEDALVRITPDAVAKRGRVPKNGNLFFSIFQTLLSGPEGAPYYMAYAPDFFDFIIIDECHRGGANDESTWRGILDHFTPAVQLGLTATPRRDVNGDTYDYFGEPVYTYSLRAGIDDGFLTPFRVKRYQTTLDEYEYASDDTVVFGDLPADRRYAERDFNRVIEIPERERYRVRLFLEAVDQRQKTLVFCATQEHAAAVRDYINQIARSRNPNYCQRVTADDGSRGEAWLRDFQNMDKSVPTVLTTSQKLSTGVDAREVRHIVLLRPINSMVEFKQIVGRGTRLFDGKEYFTIHDFVRAHDHFRDPEWDGEPEPPEATDFPLPADGEPLILEEHDPLAPFPDCGNAPWVCDDGPRRMTRIKLSDNKVREIDSTVTTMFYDHGGRVISGAEFLQQLYGDLPALFRSEAELQRLWSDPGTRRKLLETLEENGYSAQQLEDLRMLVHGQDSDLFDVLKYVAYSSALLRRDVGGDDGAGRSGANPRVVCGVSGVDLSGLRGSSSGRWRVKAYPLLQSIEVALRQTSYSL